MTKRASLSEVAKLSGVSRATVDRVLHGRGGYSAKSEKSVAAAIKELGYGAIGEHLFQKPKTLYRFKVFVPEIKCAFQDAIIRASQDAIAGLREAHVDLDFGFIDLIGGEGTIEALRAVDPSEVNGICLFAVDAPGVRSEIDRLVRSGVTICTIVSDVPSSSRIAYIGLDNVAAGRTAGHFIHRMSEKRPGTVGVITGSNEIRDHLERIMGLSQALTMYRPDARPLPPREGFSIDEKNATIVEELVAENDDLLAIYSVGGGSKGVVEGLRRIGKPEGLLVLAHELEDDVRSALIDGTLDLVIHQNTQSMMRIAINTMINAREGRVTTQETLPIELYVAENLP